MASAASKYIFLFFLSLLSSCSSGTLVGFSYHASGNTTTSSPGRTTSFLRQNKITLSQIRVFVEDPRMLSTLSNTGVAVDLYLNANHARSMMSSKSSSVSWLRTHVTPFLSKVNIKSIIVLSGNDYNRKSCLPVLLSTLKSMHRVLTSFPADRRIKVSVAFSLSALENLRRPHKRDLLRICNFIKEVESSVIVEANIDGELSMSDRFAELMIERAKLASSVLPCNDVPMVLNIKSPAVPSATEVAEFTEKVLKALGKNTQITDRLVELYAEVNSMEDFAQKELKREEEQIFPSSSRELLSDFNPKTTSRDNTPTVFPTNPISTTPLPTTPPYNPSPIVTVPSTNPVTITPVNPTTPVAVPSTTPITIPPTNPVNSPLPLTNPVTTPVTNPVTTYPVPLGGVPSPVTTPVTNPVAPPATTNAPAVPGQSWCVAKSGAQATTLQAALDYACGTTDCSQIQQGGSCYNPNSLQGHASYAFNSYYQKNPVSTSCDFGGVATIVNANPSTGSCVYSSSSSSSTPTTATPNPASTTPSPTPIIPTPIIPSPISTTPLTPISTTPPPTITSMPPPGEGVIGSVPPPSVLNSSTPASSGSMPGFGIDSPPSFNTSTSTSTGLRPSIGCIFLVTTLVTRKIVLNM